MSDTFSELSRTILDLAHVEAIRLDHGQVGPAHLLLAMLREPSNRPGELLRRLNVSVDKVRMELTKIEGDVHPEVHSYPIPRSAKLEAAIKIAVEESRLATPPGAVEPEHLLAGLLREEQHTVSQILRNLGVDVDVEDIRVAFLKRRAPNSPRPITTMDVTLRMDHLQRFSDRARKVMQLANQEAQRFNHEYVGTEHILLGLVKEGSGVAANVLKSLGIDLRKIRMEVEKIVRWGPANMVTPGNLPKTPRARHVVEYAIEVAHSLDHHHVGTEHLLLGLIREKEGVGAEILRSLDIRLDDLRDAVMAVIRSSSYAVQSAPSTPGLAAQCQSGDGPSHESIQRAEEVDQLQERPPQAGSGVDLRLNLPDIDRLVVRPGLVGRVWNFLRVLVGVRTWRVPSYEEPPEVRRYTPRARLVLHRACVEACWMNHEYLGTEHVLLGLLSEGVAARVLENLGIHPQKVRSKLSLFIRYGPEARALPKVLPWTPKALRVLEYACAEADRSGQHEFVGTEHLLLALFSEEEGVAGQVLLELGLTRESVRAEIQRLLGWPD